MEAQWEFVATINKAFKDSEGNFHVRAIASDNLEDSQGDRIHEKAIVSMARQANRNNIPILSSHQDSFAIGKVFEAKAIHRRTRVQFSIDIVLDDDFPQSRALFKEVRNGGREHQLSIGGFVDLDNEKAMSYEENKKGEFIRVINEITLDHIAITRKGFAANARTGFREAMIKSLEGIGKCVVPYKDTVKTNVNKEWNFNSDDKSKLSDSKLNLFKSAHIWFDYNDQENKSTFKLPHHKIDSDGTFKVFFKGVVAASAVFSGARGGLEIPAKDRPGVASHLGKHYKQFEKEIPAFLKSISGSENEEFVFDKEEFVEFHKNQDIDMDWFNEWLEKGFNGDNSMPADKEKKTKKDEDKTDKSEDKTKDKSEDKNEDKTEKSVESKLVDIVKDIIVKLTDIHKSEDKKVTEDSVKELTIVRNSISDFLKEIGVEENKNEDEDDDDDGEEEKDNIGNRLDILQKNLQDNNVQLASCLKSAFEDIGKTLNKIVLSKQKSGGIKDDSEGDESDGDGENVWKGIMSVGNKK